MTEEDRLAVLRGLGALDSDSDPHFDRVARLAAALFAAPRAAIVLVDRDRLWHKAIVGLPRREYPRAGSLADVMITRRETLVCADLAKDPVLREKYLETGAILKPTTPRETAEFAERERVKWKEVVRISGAKME